MITMAAVPYDAKAIANFFIDAAASEGKKLTPLQIIKLVYIAHGWYLGLTGDPLINEPAEAWRYGPVIPSVYHSLKRYGNQPVLARLTDLTADPEAAWSFAITEVPPPTDPKMQRFLQSVWKSYGHLTGIQLSSLTHRVGTPWYQAYESQRGKYIKGFDIPENSIIEHYRQLNKHAKDAVAVE
jgi:uncharacterized phage-associated protein